MQCLAAGAEPMLRAVPTEACSTCRRLSCADRAAMLGHLCALSARDLEMRFGGALAAPALERHVESIDFASDLVLALEDSTGALLALAQVMRLPRAEAVAEIAFSVHPSARRQGLGTQLMNVVLHVARAREFVRLVAQVCPRNAPMLAILRKAGMRFVREDDEMVGTLWVAASAPPEPGLRALTRLAA
jgi:GNAT superfamily N-acetyltransferase